MRDRARKASRRQAAAASADSPLCVDATVPALSPPLAVIPLTTGWLLLVILGLGLVIRLLHFWALSDTAFLRFPLLFKQSDMYAFWQWAQTILAGDLLGRDTYHPDFAWMREIAPPETWYRWWGGQEIFHQVPFYPYWIAGLLALSGNSVGFVILMQLLVGAFQPLVIFWLTRRIFDARVGLIAAALTALYGPFIFHQGTLLRDWLPPVVEPLALVALLRARASGRALDWLQAGLALGLALLIKETALLFVPLALLWVLIEHRGSMARMVAPGAVLLLGFLLCLSPLLVRNALVGAPLFALSNRAAAEAFVEANAADGFPIGYTLPPSLKGILEQANGRPWLVVGGTLETYHGDGLRFVEFQLLKLRGLVDSLEVPNNVSFGYGLEISPVLRLTLRYGIIFPIGLAGVLLFWRPRGQHALIALSAVATLGGLMAGNILARYRLTLVPVFIVYGAAALWRLVEAIQRRQGTTGLRCVGLILGLAAVQHLLLPVRAVRDMPLVVLHSTDYRLSASVYASEGRPDRAAAEIQRLVTKARQHPGFAEVALEMVRLEGRYRLLWARQLIGRGKGDEARRQIELAEAGYGPASRPYDELGLLYLELGEPAKAKRYLQRFLQIEPEGQRAEAVRRLLARLEGSP